MSFSKSFFPKKLKATALLFFHLILAIYFSATVSAQTYQTYSNNSITVLIYHRVGESQYPTTNVSETKFRAQMTFLKDNGYQILSIDQLLHTMKRKRPMPEKAAVITFDDGYLSVFKVAWPILRQYGFPFTVFIYTKAVNDRYLNFITWDQLREMQKAGADIQDHGYSHHRMADRPDNMKEVEYRAWIREDLSKSVDIMARELETPPKFFAIPYGEYNRIVIEEAKKQGYQAIFSQDPGSVGLKTDPFLIPREPILGNEWSTVAHFKKILQRVDLPIIDTTPSLDPLTTDTPQVFGAKLLYPERYVQGTLGIYVSELGWQQGRLEGDFLSIRNDAPLKRRLNRVIISGKEKATEKTALRTWMILKH